MDSLNQFISDYRKQISSLEDDLKIARTKLLGMEELQAATQGILTKATSVITLTSVALDAHTVRSSFAPRPVMTPTEPQSPSRGRRALLPQWQAVLSQIMDKGTATLDEISKENNKLERKLIRSQLSYYAKHGLVIRNPSGKYSLTPDGITACGSPKIDGKPQSKDILENL